MDSDSGVQILMEKLGECVALWGVDFEKRGGRGGEMVGCEGGVYGKLFVFFPENKQGEDGDGW